jgi:hypothetical protein
MTDIDAMPEAERAALNEYLALMRAEIIRMVNEDPGKWRGDLIARGVPAFMADLQIKTYQDGEFQVTVDEAKLKAMNASPPTSASSVPSPSSPS